MQVRWCMYLHPVDELQTIRFSTHSLKLLLFIQLFNTTSYELGKQTQI